MSEYDDPRLNKTNKKTTCTFMSSVEFHVLCVDLGFHVVIGVGRLIVRFHHAYAIPSLLDVVVRLCPVIVNLDCSHDSCKLHIAKTGPFEVLSLHHSSRVKPPPINQRVGFVVSTYLIWISGSKLILSNNQSNTTLWLLDTCLIIALLPLMIILITAPWSSKMNSWALPGE